MRNAVPIDVFSVLDKARTNVRALPSAEIHDGELVRRAKERDRWAEEALYRRYVQPIAGLVIRLNEAHPDNRVLKIVPFQHDAVRTSREAAPRPRGR
jgi:hypothetical protein